MDKKVKLNERQLNNVVGGGLRNAFSGAFRRIKRDLGKVAKRTGLDRHLPPFMK